MSTWGLINRLVIYVYMVWPYSSDCNNKSDMNTSGPSEWVISEWMWFWYSWLGS